MSTARTVLRGTTGIDVRDGVLNRDVDITIDAGRITSITPSTADDLDRVTVLGHSAGGHLALWAAAALARRRVHLAAAVGLAPVADLVLAHELGCGSGAVRDFLGGSPQDQRPRYESA